MSPISSRTTGASGTNRRRTSRSRGNCSATSWRRGRSRPTSQIGSRIGLENSRPRCGPRRRGGAGRRGPRWVPRNHGSERSRKSSARDAPSAVFIVGLLEPTQHFGIDLIGRPESNLDSHRLLDSRRLQASTRLSPLEPKAEIDAVLRRRLDPREGPPCRYERDVGLAGLDRDLAKARGSVDNRIENWSQLRPIRVLSVNQFVRGSEEKVWVAKSLHHQKRLSVAGHALLREPRPEGSLIVQPLPFDASIPSIHALSGALLQESSRHVFHLLPVTRLGHRHLRPAAAAGGVDRRSQRKSFRESL